MNKRYRLTEQERRYANSDHQQTMMGVLGGGLVYEYRINEPCTICGKHDEKIVMSTNPHKTRLTPFRETDTMKFSCGHEMPMLGLTVRRKE